MTVSVSRALRSSLVFLAAIAMAACASHPKPMGPVATNVPPPPPPSDRGYDTAPVDQAPLDQGSGPGSARDFVLKAGDLVYFDFDRYEVRAEARAVLDLQVAWLARYPSVRVRVEGNTDERGTREYNFALGARRANAVRDYLVERGIAASRIETVSYGKEKPVDPTTGDKADAINRNARTIVVGGAR